MGLPDADALTTERLLHADDRAEVGAQILSAVVAFLVGTTGQARTAEVLREWADEVEAHATGVIGHG